MPKKKPKFCIFVWDPLTEKWSASSEQYNIFELEIGHHKTVAGRPWTVYTHSKNPGVFYGRWTDSGPDVPPHG